MAREADAALPGRQAEPLRERRPECRAVHVVAVQGGGGGGGGSGDGGGGVKEAEADSEEPGLAAGVLAGTVAVCKGARSTA